MSRLSLKLTLLGVVVFAVPGFAAERFLGKGAADWENALLNGPDARARRNAAFALGKIGSDASAAVPTLIKFLGEDKEESVREAAAFALGDIAKESLAVQQNPSALVTALGRALKDTRPLVRRSAAYALGCLGPGAKGAQGALEAAYKENTDMDSGIVRQNVAWALGRIGPGTLPTLRLALRDKDLLVRRDAAGSVGQLDPEAARAALPELLGCLEAPTNSEVRFAALTVMIKLVGEDDAKAVGPIRQALSDSDLEVRQNAALALANIGGPPAAAALPVLLDALKRGDLEMKQQAAAAIRNIGPDAAAAIDELIKLLSAPDSKLRRYSALALGGIGPKAGRAILSLVDLLANPREDSEARIEAAVALSRMGKGEEAVKAVPLLLQVLGDPRNDPKVRERVIWALRVHNVGLRDLNVYPTFTKILSEPKNKENRMLRYDCAYMLGMLQGPEAPEKAVDTLLDFLKDDSILIFRGKSVTTGGGGTEVKSGTATVKEEGKGDGRVMAIQALDRIGSDRVARRNDVIAQLRTIAANPGTLADLKEATKKLLQNLGK